jgi:hypothetical protein
MASSDATTVLRAQERVVIVQIATMIMNSAKSLSSWSKTIPPAFHLGTVTELSDGMMITIGNSALEAHAFEHGSGIHGPGGSKYPIVARNAPLLAFMGTHGSSGHLITVPSVQHPGVGARPFMAPAVEANRAEALELLKQAVGSAVRLTIQEAFRSK